MKLKKSKSFKDFIGTNSLLICPSLEWGSLERRVLKDALFQKKLGVRPTIYCFKKSVLSSFAIENDIKVLFTQNKKINELVDIQYFLELRKILKENNYGLVHCFSTRYIWMAALVLKSFRSIPLFLTINKRINFSFRGLIYKWLLRRVDRIFAFSQTMIDIVPTFLDVPKRKVKFSGFGLDENPNLKESAKLLVIVVSSDQVQKLEAFIVKLLHVLKKHELKLMVYYDRSVEFKSKVNKIKDIIISLGVGEIVGLRKFTSEDIAFQKNRILIGLSNKEAVTDYEVSALLRDTLVLSARSLARSNVSRLFYGALQTYKFTDDRNFLKNLEYLILNGPSLISKLETQKKEVIFYHGQSNYFELLTTNFLKINKVRLRFSRSKKRKNSLILDS